MKVVFLLSSLFFRVTPGIHKSLLKLITLSRHVNLRKPFEHPKKPMVKINGRYAILYEGVFEAKS